MEVKHLAGHHNQKTHGQQRNFGKPFAAIYGLSVEEENNLQHLNSITWPGGGFGLENVVEAFNNAGLPVYRFMMDPDYDPAAPGKAPNDSYFEFGTKKDPEYFNLMINGRLNRAFPFISIHQEENTRGKAYIDYMLTEGSALLDKIESVLKSTGRFGAVQVASHEVPIMLLADKGYRVYGLQKPEIEAAYNFLEKKYNLRVPVGPLPKTKDILVSDLLTMKHPLYPDVPLFEELLLNEPPGDYLDVAAYKNL